MKESFTHIPAPGELTLPLDDLQSGDEILLSERQKINSDSSKHVSTSQMRMTFESTQEIYGLPAIAVTALRRVGESAHDFPKEETFLIPLKEDGTIPLNNGLTIMTYESDGLVSSTVSGDWTRLRVFRPEGPEQKQKQAARGLGKRALIPSLFFGFKE